MVDYFNSCHKLIFVYYLLNLSWNNEDYDKLIKDNIIIDESFPVKLYNQSKYPFQLNLTSLIPYLVFISMRIDFNYFKSLEVLNIYKSNMIYKYIDTFEIFENLQKLNVSSMNIYILL